MGTLVEHMLHGTLASVVERMGSVVAALGSRVRSPVVVVLRFGCLAACVIFPDQGSNPCPLRWQADS